MNTHFANTHFEGTNFILPSPNNLLEVNKRKKFKINLKCQRHSCRNLWTKLIMRTCMRWEQGPEASSAKHTCTDDLPLRYNS